MDTKGKPYTLNELLRDLRKLANRYNYPKLLELLDALEKYLPNRFRQMILIDETCCNTFPWLCDDGCQRLDDELRGQAT